MLSNITSEHNPYVKKLYALREGKGRREHGLFLVEGERVVSEIPEDWPVESYLFAEGRAPGDCRAYEARAPVCVLAARVAARVSGLVTPPGVMAVCARRDRAPGAVFEGGAPLVLIGDQISDPGNLGALVRTADAAGCAGVLLTEGSADVYGPKALRAMSGAVFHLPIAQGLTATEAAALCAAHGVVIAAARLDAADAPYEVDFTGPRAVAIGNEAHGLGAELTRAARLRVKIPMPGRAESLNAAVACGILLYEAVRQRNEEKR